MVMILGMAMVKSTSPMVPSFVDKIAARLDWARRMAIGGLTIAAAITLWHGTVTLTAGTTPDIALSLDPGNVRANAASADQSLAQSDLESATIASRRALIRSPAAPSAVRSLGLAASLSKRQDAASAAFRYANILSRRDLGTNLWFIEFAVAQNNVDAALHRYDIALRTSSSAYATLFPILTGVLDDSEYVTPIVRVLTANPPWMQNFLEYAFNTKTPPLDLARLGQSLAQNGKALPNDLERMLVERLALAGEYDAAWQAYLRLKPNSTFTKRGVRDEELVDRQPSALFDWQYANTGESIAMPQSKDRPTQFRSFAEQPVSVLSQLLLLLPGNYAILAPTHITTGTSRPRWILSCVTDNRILGEVIASTSTALTKFAFVDVNCRAQWLRLIVQGTAMAPTEGKLHAVKLVRLGSTVNR